MHGTDRFPSGGSTTRRVLMDIRPATVPLRLDRRAPATSLLGQLQRGRGAGYLVARAADRTAVAAYLVSCVLVDPYTGGSLTRADYYATLALHVDLDLAPLADFLQVEPSASRDLAAHVLARLAWRGSAAACSLVVRMLSSSRLWPLALAALVGSGYAPSCAELGRPLLARLPDDRTLLAALEQYPEHHALWERWAQEEPRIAAILAQRRDQRLRQEEASGLRPGTVTGDLRAILAATSETTVARSSSHAAGQATEADVPVLLEALFGEDEPRLRVAAAALSALHPAAALPHLVAYLDGFHPTGASPIARLRARHIAFVLTDIPDARAAALTWLQGDDPWRQGYALWILAQQGTVADVPALRRLAAACIEPDAPEQTNASMFSLCLDALSRFSALVPAEELAYLVEQAVYPSQRARAAMILARGHRAVFVEQYAVECLWDSETQTIMLGCMLADTGRSDVHARLTELRDDAYGNELIRKAAAMRLTAQADQQFGR